MSQWVRSLDLTTHTSLSPIRRGFAPGFVDYKKGALDSQPQVIKLTSCLPMVGGFLRVLRLPPPLKTGRHDIAEILLKVTLKHQKLKKSTNRTFYHPFILSYLSFHVIFNYLWFSFDDLFHLAWCKLYWNFPQTLNLNPLPLDPTLMCF